MNETLSNTQERVLRLFTYLQALEQLRNPVVRELGRHAWFLRVRDLPEHECIEFRPWIDGGMHEGGEDDLSIKGEGDFILRSRRPYVPDAPAPPKVLDGWLTEPLDDPEAEPERIPWKEVLNHEGDTVRRSFDEDAQRRDAWTSYRARWEEWRRTASSATMARRVFEKLYGLFGRLEREGDRLELVVGDGLLRWRHNQLGSIEHPILLQRVQLKFDPEIPEFTITEADYDVEFYTSLLRLLPEVDGHTLAVLRGTMEQGLLHPLEGDETANFFRRVIGRLSPRGEFFEEPVADPPSDNPVICRDPVFFLRTRSGGIAQAIESIVEVVKQGQRESPASLRRIVGIESEPSEDTQEGDESIRSISSPEDVPDVLYSKAANPEQVQIAKKLEARDSVIVQGPPGTGKSHTIANLLGHLLAQGMSVLVTSHSTKALRVLRELVEEPLRGLCVSVLDRDDDSRHELQ
ncbi:MAG: AAA family ATPase, partial [Gammaproteobacteria bacterium]